MPKLNILGVEMYLRMKPTFPGAKAPVLCTMPSTALHPTDGQKKARTWLINAAHGKKGTYGTVSDAGHGKGGTKLGLELNKVAPGKGSHVSGWREPHFGATRKQKTDAQIQARLAEYRT